MRKNESINIIIHPPSNKESILLLEQAVSKIHADAVCKQIQKLNCDPQQKTDLLNSIIETIKKEDE